MKQVVHRGACLTLLLVAVAASMLASSNAFSCASLQTHQSLPRLQVLPRLERHHSRSSPGILKSPSKIAASLSVSALSLASTLISERRKKQRTRTTTALSIAAIALAEPTEVVLTESQKMEGQIIELTNAINAMSKKWKALQIDKATRNYEATAMKSEMRDLRTQLEGKDIVEGDLTATLKRVEAEKVRIILERGMNSDCMAIYHHDSQTCIFVAIVIVIECADRRSQQTEKRSRITKA
jgi:hypothetical protein